MIQTVPVIRFRPIQHATLPAAMFAGLVVALALLVAAFLLTSQGGDRQFDLARLAERQAAIVARIATLPGTAGDRAQLIEALDRLDGLIGEEQHLTPAGGADARRAGQERAEVARLRELALDPARRQEFRQLTAIIDRREAHEVEAARATLFRLHRRAAQLALLLAGAVLACAAAGAWLLVRRNRVLAAEVRARARQVEAVDASRRLFFAKTSHELRTPIQGMRGTAEIALAAPHPQPAMLREALEHVLAGTIALGHRIDELLGLASADNGQLQLQRATADLGAIVAGAIAECGSLARSVDSAMTLAAPAGPTPVFADARWLKQALIAVIENGLKFSPMGVPLAVAVTASGAAARITITDQGPGVVDAELPRIFDAFYQAEAGRTRGGNGLGLALARWVVEQHAGSIAAANLAAGGCCVTIVLPLESRS